MVGAITTLIDIRIGHFPKESITGSIISLVLSVQFLGYRY